MLWLCDISVGRAVTLSNETLKHKQNIAADDDIERERVRDRQIVTASLLNMVLSFTLCVVTAHFIGIWQPIWYELNQLNANRKQITLEFQETCWEAETELFLITDNFNPRKITTCTVCSGIAAQSKLGWE